MLREVVPMLRQQLDKSMLDRNFVQLERDAIQEYYNISQREVRLFPIEDTLHALSSILLYYMSTVAHTTLHFSHFEPFFPITLMIDSPSPPSSITLRVSVTPNRSTN